MESWGRNDFHSLLFLLTSYNMHIIADPKIALRQSYEDRFSIRNYRREKWEEEYKKNK